MLHPVRRCVSLRGIPSPSDCLDSIQARPALPGGPLPFRGFSRDRGSGPPVSCFGVAGFVVAKIGTCWWCGAKADSREHKFRRTDLQRGFGVAPYYDGRTLVRQGYEGRQSEMTGPKSNALKFRPMICRKCNNERSQQFDRAYDQFMDYVFAHEQEIMRAESLDLRDVFGGSWQPDTLNLVRYIVKHICCRLAEVSDRRVIWLDKRLHRCLNGGGFPACLQLDVFIDPGVLEFLRFVRLTSDADEPKPEGTFLHLTGLFGPREDDRAKPLMEPQAGMTVGGLTIWWRIADDGSVPNPFQGPVVHIPVGDSVFPVEQRTVMTRICDAAEAGEIDVAGRTLDELLADFRLS
jgi:hypothetical protein